MTVNKKISAKSLTASIFATVNPITAAARLATSSLRCYCQRMFNQNTTYLKTCRVDSACCQQYCVRSLLKFINISTSYASKYEVLFFSNLVTR